MSKILGDDPFGDKTEKPDDTADAKAEKKPLRPRKKSGKTTSSMPVVNLAELGLEDADSAPVAVADAVTAPMPVAEVVTAPMEAVPPPAPLPVPEPAADIDSINAAPDSQEPEDAFEDVYYGAEAAPAPGEYGPSLDKRKEIPYARQSITEEVRELERRVKARLTPAFPIEKRRKLPLQSLWKRTRELAMRGRSDVVDDFGRDPAVASRWSAVLDFLYERYFRVSTVGLENLPPTGRGLLVANHSGTLPYDGAMLMHAVRKETHGERDVRPLIEDFIFHFPYLGTLVNRLGGVRACPENAERLLADDQLVAVFPEGIKGIGKPFRKRYQLQRFGRGGFVRLALRTGAPIVPTAILGAEEIHPMLARLKWLAKPLGLPYLPVTPTFPLLGPLGLLPLPTKWTIRFGKPLDYAREYGPEAADDRILVNKLAETVRSTIQEMIDEALAERKSILFG